MDVRDFELESQAIQLHAGLYTGFVNWIILSLDAVSISQIFNLLLTCWQSQYFHTTYWIILDPTWDCGLSLNFNCSYKKDRRNKRERLRFLFLQEIKLNSTHVMDKSKQLWRKRARLHFSEEKHPRVRLEETGLHAWLRSSNMSFVSPLSQTWSVSVPAVWRLHLPSTNQRRCPPHTNTNAKTITSSSELPCAHMFLQASEPTHTLSVGLKRNQSCRAGWSRPCFLSQSFIFAPQQESRHHKSHPRYSIAVPTMEGKKESLSAFVCCGYI